MRRALAASAVLSIFLASCATSSPSTTHAASSTTAISSSRPLATATPARFVHISAMPSLASDLVVDRIKGLGRATQAIVVTSTSWNTDLASLEAFEKDAGTWHRFGVATSAFVGRNGFAADKREGDGRTPAGIYPISMMFGTSPNPGVRFAYRQAGADDVWVDDPSSSLYNTWQRDPSNGRWSSAERLYQPGPYRYAAVIAYNTARTPGRGSAIFLHVSLGRGTTGCVAIGGQRLVELMRWLDPAHAPRIVMGPSSYVDAL